jgi:uncharacterized protein YidB (DUF937 family)
MCLPDVLNGMQNGPRGSRGLSGGGGAMSPMTMALLGLLAYKAVKSYRGRAAQPGIVPAPGGGGFGGLGDVLMGDVLKGLGGGSGRVSGAGGLGSLLSGGLSDLFKQFQSAGKGDVGSSWVGTGQNQPIIPTDLSKILTPEQIDFLTGAGAVARGTAGGP